MTLSEYLRADLRRSFEVEVDDRREPTGAELFRRSLSPRFMPVLLIRLARWAADAHVGILAKFFSALNVTLFGLEVSAKCEIGPGLYLPHTVGTVIGATRIGANATIFHNVTLGAKELDIQFNPLLRPVLENNVTVGAGGKVVGGITLHDGCVVGANAVVTRSVLPGQVVVGIPARPLVSDEGNNYAVKRSISET